MTHRKTLSLILCLAALAGCSNKSLFENKLVSEAKVTDRTRATDLLMSLPAPADKMEVAVYDFQDLTGQFRNNGLYTDYSSAVTKGGHAILTKALLDAGNRQWFTVIERGNLKDLLQERQIIKVMRDEYQARDGSKMPALPPLVVSGLLIEGGIISYDSNVVTGGAGATYLGISASAQYHRDVVTVYLRAVSVKTGEVLLSVTSSKTIFSTLVDSNILKYLTFDRLLQAEVGFSVNEPTQLGVRQAIEAGVYSMIMEGAINHLWDFKDPAMGQKAVDDYLKRRDGKAYTRPVAQSAPKKAPPPPTAASMSSQPEAPAEYPDSAPTFEPAPQTPPPAITEAPVPYNPPPAQPAPAWQPEPASSPAWQPEPEPAPQATPAWQPQPATAPQTAPAPAPQTQAAPPSPTSSSDTPPPPPGVPENAIIRWKPAPDASSQKPAGAS